MLTICFCIFQANVTVGTDGPELISKNPAGGMFKMGPIKVASAVDLRPESNPIQLFFNAWVPDDKEEERRLESAVLECCLLKTNRVMDLAVEITASRRSDVSDSVDSVPEIGVDEGFELRASIITEDGNPLSLDGIEDFFEVTVKNRPRYRSSAAEGFGGKKIDPWSIFDEATKELSSSGASLKRLNEKIDLGEYEVTITYEEKRPEFNTLSNIFKRVKRSKQFIVIPGRPKELRIGDSSSLSSYATWETPLFDQICIVAFDGFRNPTRLSASHSLFCYLAAAGSSETASGAQHNHSLLPLTLQGSSVDHRVYGEYDEASGGFVFRNVCVQWKDGQSPTESAVSAEFCVSDGNQMLPPLVKLIQFCDNNARTSKLKELQSRKLQLEDEVEQYANWANAVTTKRKAKEAKVRDIIKKLDRIPNSYRFYASTQESNGPSQSDFAENIRKCDEELQQMLCEASQKRVAVKPINSDMQAEGVIGLVVDLATVASDEYAKIASWAAEEFMSAAVVKRSKEAMTVIEQFPNRRVISLDAKSVLCRSYIASKLTNLLRPPGPPIQLPNLSGLAGDPKYLVSLG
jgi:hypothetical protein